jgi:uncharacterized protein
VKNLALRNQRDAIRNSVADSETEIQRGEARKKRESSRLLFGIRKEARWFFLFSPTRLLFLSLLAFAFASTAFSQDAKIPKLFKRATDFTNTLSAQELNSLEADLARFEDSTSNQLVVVMVATTGGEDIEGFALRTAEANRIGQKGKDNGALLLIAKDDRKMRIEVGYGLEGVLPDGLAGYIIRREISPNFRNGDYYAGIKSGTDAIMAATRNEYKAEKQESFNLSPLIMIGLFLLVMFLVMRSARRRGSHLRGGRIPMYFPGGWSSPDSVVGGSHSSGDWGSSGGGGGGSDWGGFSGGGGSFGGGGSSGSW